MKPSDVDKASIEKMSVEERKTTAKEHSADKSSTCKVYYDGLCPLCSREIDHYRKQEGVEKLSFIDITAADFDAQKEGLDPRAVHKVMHVRGTDGRVKTGVDAFIEIWKILPRYRWASKLAQQSLVRPALDLGYQVFATVRPFLPRRKRDCEASPYCETKEKP